MAGGGHERRVAERIRLAATSMLATSAGEESVALPLLMLVDSDTLGDLATVPR